MIMKPLLKPNYIANSMQLIDIQYAFGLETKQKTKTFIYEVLIPEGYIRKHGERHFKALNKIMELAYLPETLELIDFQSRFFAYNERFSYSGVVDILEGNDTIARKLIVMGYLLLEKNGNYRKSNQFEELLAEGETKILLKI